MFSNQAASYYVMELCSHGPLSSLLLDRTTSALSESELRGVIKSLVDGLMYLRKELVIHRDLSLEKVLITEDYRIVGD